MAKTTPLQTSFASGELSPRMQARWDIQAYQEGCQILKNFIARSRGPAQSRDGFRFIDDIPVIPGVTVFVTTVRLVITTPAVDVQVS